MEASDHASQALWEVTAKIFEGFLGGLGSFLSGDALDTIGDASVVVFILVPNGSNISEKGINSLGCSLGC